VPTLYNEADLRQVLAQKDSARLTRAERYRRLLAGERDEHEQALQRWYRDDFACLTERENKERKLILMEGLSFLCGLVAGEKMQRTMLEEQRAMFEEHHAMSNRVEGWRRECRTPNKMSPLPAPELPRATEEDIVSLDENEVTPEGNPTSPNISFSAWCNKEMERRRREKETEQPAAAALQQARVSLSEDTLPATPVNKSLYENYLKVGELYKSV